jgi:methylthioribose-1-phosphate isomerase
MKVGETYYRSIWEDTNAPVRQRGVHIIDQQQLPHRFATATLATLADAADAIASMRVRGAPLIGITAAYGMAFAACVDSSDTALSHAAQVLMATRPTAVNLAWAVQQVSRHLATLPPAFRGEAAWTYAARLADDDVAQNSAIGEHGLPLIAGRDRVVNILTHCNAGWLAAVDWGTALAPIYRAHDAGCRVHVWVDETRPRNQGLLTSWELAQHGVPHTVIVDNAGGQLMRDGHVDLCIVGADRVAANGDVANKIGTYLKALAAKDNGIPFFVAVPDGTFDAAMPDGRAIHIEERHGDEIRKMRGLTATGEVAEIDVLPADRAVANPAFDITPARLVTGFITPRGVVAPGAA